MKENLSKVDLVSSFDQVSVENENMEIKNQDDFQRQSLPNNPPTTLRESELHRRGKISFITLENDDEITKVRFSPYLNENKVLSNKSLSSHNATISQVSDGDQANPEEAIDSTNDDFKQIEEDKTRSFKILIFKKNLFETVSNTVLRVY